MRHNIIYLTVLLGIITYCLHSCRFPLPGTSNKQLVEYTLELDEQDWLCNVAANANDSLFQMALFEMNHVRRDSAMHPLDPFIAVVMFNQWAPYLEQWFPALVPPGTVEAEAFLRLEQAFESATTRLYSILEKRMEASDVQMKKIEVMDKVRIHLQVYEENQNNVQRLLPRGDLGFYETYTYNELVEGIGKVGADIVAAQKVDTEAAQEADTTTIRAEDTAYTMEALFKDKGNEGNRYESEAVGDLFLHPDLPVVGHIQSADTAVFAESFRLGVSRGYFPQNVRFVWGPELADEYPDVYPYIALKTTEGGKPRLSGQAVVSARQDFEPNSVSPMISISMSPEGASEWRRMTRFNIGRSIAIVMDGELLTYPTVQQEIVGGRSQITGNFTVEEAKILALNIQSGSYPAAIRLVNRVVLSGQ
jgi:SecD/SecF fusion protein